MRGLKIVCEKDTFCSSAAIYCSIICTKSATCNAFHHDASNCYGTSHGKSLLAAWEGSVNVKSVYVAQGMPKYVDDV